MIATDYAFWPLAVRNFVAKPLCERVVPPSELAAFLAPRRRQRFDWSGTQLIGPVFPKIGVCSWKEWPWLLPYGPSVPLNLFDFCSPRMRLVLSAWSERDAPVSLRFFPYIDYAHVNEYRFASRRLSLTRSVCRDDHDGQGVARAIAAVCARHLDDCMIDVATKVEGAGVHAWLVEINPWIGARQ